MPPITVGTLQGASLIKPVCRVHDCILYLGGIRFVFVLVLGYTVSVCMLMYEQVLVSANISVYVRCKGDI